MLSVDVELQERTDTCCNIKAERATNSIGAPVRELKGVCNSPGYSSADAPGHAHLEFTTEIVLARKEENTSLNLVGGEVEYFNGQQGVHS